MSRISPLKDYREALGLGSRNKTQNTASITKNTGKQIYERQEDLQPSRLYTPDTAEKLPRPSAEPQNLLLTRAKQRLTDNLQHKIESILKHNAHLLNENAALAELLTERNAQIQVLQKRLQTQMNEQVNTLNMIEIEKNKYVIEVQQKLRERDFKIEELVAEIARTLHEISRLKADMTELENVKNREMGIMKQQLSRKGLEQVESLKKVQNSNIQLYELQVKKLKQANDEHKHHHEASEHDHRLQVQKLQQQINQLQADIKHLAQMRELELAELKLHNDNIVDQMTRETGRIIETERSTNEAARRKLKKELDEKMIEIEKLRHKLNKNQDDNQTEYKYLLEGKERAEVEMSEQETRMKDDRTRQRHRLDELANAEKEALINQHKQYVDAMQSQISKLEDINAQRKAEIDRLLQQQQQLRHSHFLEQQSQQTHIEHLTERLEQTEKQHLEELQLFKIKMAHLLNGDVKSLQSYYEGQLLAQAEQKAALDKFNKELKEQIQREIESRTELRKQLELELAAEKMRVAELTMKLANIQVEMRESLASVGSRNELTSETLLRQVHQKEKISVIVEDQKKKLHQLIKAKDIEIEQLNEKIQRLRKQSTEQIQRKQDEIDNLKKNNAELDSSHNKQREFYERELKKKESIWKEQKDKLQKELDDIGKSTYEQLRQELAELRKDNMKMQKEIEAYERTVHGHVKQLAVHRDNMEVMKLESGVALEGQKQTLIKNKSDLETQLKRHYEETIKARDNDISDLRRKLNEKQTDLKDLILRYNQLQKKLAALMESQQKLRDFEQKVVNLGMDTNLVKNMAEMMRSKLK